MGPMKRNRTNSQTGDPTGVGMPDRRPKGGGGPNSPELDEFTQFAVEHLADATYLMQEDAGIIYVNEAASRLVGYTIDELCGMKVYELNVDLDRTRWPAIWALLKAEGKRTFEARHRHKDGRVLDVEITAHFLELGGKEYSCAFVRDIGDRRQLEQRLRHAEKMEAIGRLAGGVAHDFNNQLAGILGYSEVLRLKIDNCPEAVELVDKLTHVVKVAADQTSRLLAFSRRGKFLVEPVDLHAMLRDVESMLSRSIDKRVSIDLRMAADRPWVSGDPSQLENAILNLALNARDAMPEGGTLTITTDNIEIGDGADAALPPGLGSGTYVTVTVRDTGIGMDKATQDRVFEPFFTTKDAAGGVGLGLAAVYGTVTNHRGGIVVDSEPGAGTSFTIYLPVTRPSASVGSRRDSGEPVGQRLHGHVLLVEDEPDVREVCGQMLEALGCTVTTAADGGSALATFREHHDRIDLVLLDLVLPRVNGPEVFRAIRDIDAEVPVLVVSGFSVDGEAQQLIDDGARGFLQKPFTLAALAGAVAQALRSP
jgi:PAS domain S-box-containing protein